MDPGSKPDFSFRLPKDRCPRWRRWHYHSFWSIFLSFQYMSSSKWPNEPTDVAGTFSPISPPIESSDIEKSIAFKFKNGSHDKSSRQCFSKNITKRKCYFVRPNTHPYLRELNIIYVVFESSAEGGLNCATGNTWEIWQHSGNTQLLMPITAIGMSMVLAVSKLRTANYALLSVLHLGDSQLLPIKVIIKHNKTTAVSNSVTFHRISSSTTVWALNLDILINPRS